ncbi:hypothetical protein EYF80_002379 [Liparis tanakae]|uniref:Uncharacterized protein n=1 Tax=Liparis tanakae TaxID=230148 RepID=A0A4Z2JAZ4_9TELE|nr:hypothetical protein EYF80_002379 [Liparis tanakae]
MITEEAERQRAEANTFSITEGTSAVVPASLCSRAVARRPEDHVTHCQGTEFIQWLLAAALAAAQLFHTGRNSNRSLPLKQQRSVVAPEPVKAIEKGSCTSQNLVPRLPPG